MLSKVRIIAVLVLIIGGAGCTQTKESTTPVSHIVLVWLKDPSQADALAVKSRELFSNIDQVKAFHIGTPAGTDRPIVDNSYSLCLTTYFENKDEMKEYLEHPLHVAFLKEYGPEIEKILVYDASSE